MKRISFFTFVTLLAFTTVWGQSKVSPFTTHYMMKQQAVTRSVALDEVVSAYLYTEGTPDISLLEALGVKVSLQLDGILTARVPLSSIDRISQLDFIRYIQLGTPVQPMMDKARSASNVDLVHSGESLTMPYTGKGVVVGIIDGGFDYTHPAFLDDETKALRIKRVWEQGSTEGKVPVGFGYGIELTTPEEILAAKADVTTQSHGSHVAAIAAGAYRVEENAYYGIAPDADIVLVSKGAITTNSANISDAIAYIYNYADSVGKPCVVNMSLGWHQGPHDGTSPFDLVADQLQAPGRVLVGSMGNYGNDAVHVSKAFTDATDAPLKAMVAYKITPSKDKVGGEIDIWGDKGMEFDLQVIATRTADGSQTLASEVMPVVAGQSSTQEFVLSDRIKGNVLITTEVNPLNGKPHAFLTLGVESRRMGMTLGVIVTPRTAGTVHAWTDAGYTTFETTVPEGWTPGDKQYTLCEIGGTGQEIISVGAYVSSNTYTEAGSSQAKLTDEKLGHLATFSSVGPTIDGRMKPDVIAPGTFIASAVNSYDAYRSSYPTASVVAWNDNAYYYSYMQGTSMAAPFVSGVVATWLQAYPQLDSRTIRDILQKTAKNDEFTASSTCGYGKIDAYAGLKEVLAIASSIEDVSSDDENTVTLRLSDDCLTLCFVRPVGSVDIRLYDAVGSLLEGRQVDVTEAGQIVSIPLSGRVDGLCLLRVGTEVYKIVRK